MNATHTLNTIFKITTLCTIVFGISACSSMSKLPKEENVKVSRNEPSKDCETLGKLEGRSLSKVPNEEEALKDLRQEAANKGANYLVVKQYSTLGTSVTGMAYKCP